MFSTEEKKEALQEKLKRIGQDGLLAFYEELNEAEKSALLCDIEAIDFPLMERLYQQATGKPSDASAAGRIEPISGNDDGWRSGNAPWAHGTEGNVRYRIALPQVAFRNSVLRPEKNFRRGRASRTVVYYDEPEQS